MPALDPVLRLLSGVLPLANVTVVLLVVGVIALVVVGAVLGHLAEKKRREALRRFARRQGLGFSPDHDHAFERRYPMFDCFTKGRDRYAFNVFHGQQQGRSLVGFDYHYATTSRDSEGRTRTHHHRFSGVIVDSGLSLGSMTVREEGFFDKVTGFFGFDDIDFESSAFSDMFHVRAKDRRLAYALLPQTTMELLLESPRFEIQVVGPYVLARRDRRFEPRQFREALDLVHGLLDRIPDDLEDELRLVPA